MRQLLACVSLCLAACATGDSSASPYIEPNSLMAAEITNRVEQIQYLHREELLHNLVWLRDQGEQVIPSLLTGMQHENAKVRSSCAWVLGQLRDRRTVPGLMLHAQDADPAVRTEVARTLVLMGELSLCSTLIEGLDHSRREVRAMCHEALQAATGHDFGYDHLASDDRQRREAVLRWRQWWAQYSGDATFAASYQATHGLSGAVAAPAGETKSGGA